MIKAKDIVNIKKEHERFRHIAKVSLFNIRGSCHNIYLPLECPVSSINHIKFPK